MVSAFDSLDQAVSLRATASAIVLCSHSTRDIKFGTYTSNKDDDADDDDDEDNDDDDDDNNDDDDDDDEIVKAIAQNAIQQKYMTYNNTPCSFMLQKLESSVQVKNAVLLLPIITQIELEYQQIDRHLQCISLVNAGNKQVVVCFTGIYSWIGVNFELGRFDHSHDTQGILFQIKICCC